MTVLNKVIKISETAENKSVALLYSFTIIAFLLLIATRIGVVFCYDPEIVGIDNNFVYPVIRMLKGLSIYPNPENYPFVVNPYSPLLFYISYPICKIFNIYADNTIEVYYVVKSVCFVCDLITSIILFRITSKYLYVSRHIATLTSVCFLFLISYWSYTIGRSDSLELMWYSCIVLCILNYFQNEKIHTLITLALLCNLAIFSKQNAIFAPLTIVAILLLQKRMVKALVFSVVFGFVLVSLLSIFMYIYPDGTFLDHLFRALNNRLDPQWYYINIFKRLVLEFTFIPFALGCWLSFQISLKSKDLSPRIISYFSIASVIFSLIIALKWGSGLGYFHESFFTIACLLAYSSNNCKMKNLLSKIYLPIIFILIFIFTAILSQLFFYHLNDRSEDQNDYRKQKEVATFLMNELRQSDTYVFVDGTLNTSFFKNLLQDRIVVPNKDAVDCCTLPDGNFNYSLFKQGFSNGKIQFIIYKDGEELQSFHGIQFTNFIPYKVLNGYIILRSKQALSFRSTSSHPIFFPL